MLVAVSLLAACGGDDETPTAATTSTTGSTATTAARGRGIEAHLLTLEDLPDGFSEGRVSGRDDTARGCMPALSERATETAVAGFARPGRGPLVSQTVARFEPGGAEERLRAIRDALASCRSYDDIDEDQQRVTYHVSPMELETFGDESVAFEITGSQDAADVAIDVVVIRDGDLATSLFHLSLVDPDPNLTRSLARTAAARLDR